MGTVTRAAGRLLDQVAELPGRLIQSSVIIAIFIGIGVTLIAMRFLFMEFAPFGAKHAKLTADFVNILMDIIWAMFEALRVVIAAIVALVRFIEGKPRKHFTVHDPPHKISAETMRHFLLTIPVQCHDFTWSSDVLILWPLKQLLSPSFCPALRYLWPVPWLYNIVYPVLGWASEDPTPVTGGNNCQAPRTTDWVCVGFGSGYLVLEVLVPLLVFILVAWPLLAVLVGQAFVITELSFAWARRIAQSVVHTLESVGAAVERALSVN